MTGAPVAPRAPSSGAGSADRSADAGEAAIPDRLPMLQPPSPSGPDVAADDSPTPIVAASPDGVTARLTTAAAHAAARAPFLRALIRRDPAGFARAVADPAAALTHAHAHATDAAWPVARRLREARAEVALAVALADIAGLWPLAHVTAALSDFADLALGEAIAAAIAERVPGAASVGFTAIALGKLGSGELNYSSDIDLIFLHDRATLPRRARDDPDEAAVRIGRRVIELLQARDPFGYVARVDLRLRPSPEATPIVIPVEAAISYYHAEAEPWERAAFIRARAAAGDIALGEKFLAEVAPFVWRRSLDYQAIREVRAISARIRDHFAAGQHPGPGYDLKRGRGGIREIEFFAQTHQLIFGGRDASLRGRATPAALAALAAADRIDPAEAATLTRAYGWLRAAEHRAQMIEDAQTHRVPAGEAERENYARFAGYEDFTAFARDLEAVAGAVTPIYARVAGPPAPAAAPREAEALGAWLEAHDLPGDAETQRLFAGWRDGGHRALRAPAARAALEAILPDLARAFAAAAEPRVAWIRFDRFLTELPAGVGFLTLVAANPPLVALLARLLSSVPALADALARRPQLFDVLLDAGAFAPLPGAAALTAELCAFIAGVGGAEERLDRVRRWTGERRFQIGAQLTEGRTDPLDAARAYAGLADAALIVLAEATRAEFEATHGHVPGGRLIVLAMGRHGGAMLTARSDLDLVYLHSGPADAVAIDGPRPTPAAVHFTRLAQRLTAALSVPTAAGALYEIDTRLRPSGAKGPLVAPVEAFARYQRDEAWTWEHMALTRARVVVGTSEDRAEVEAAIAAVLEAPRDRPRLVADALAIRADMDRHRPGGGEWEVKLGPGGLIDLEFLVHVEQLASGVGLTPDLAAAARALAAAGRIAPEIEAAHDLLTRALVLGRLMRAETSGTAEPPPLAAERLIAAAAGLPDGAALRAALARAKQVVIAQWRISFGQPREEHPS